MVETQLAACAYEVYLILMFFIFILHYSKIIWCILGYNIKYFRKRALIGAFSVQLNHIIATKLQYAVLE